MVNLQITLRPEVEGDVAFLFRLYRDTRSREVAGWGWPPEQEELFLSMQFEAQRRGYWQMYPEATGRIIRAAETDVGRLLVNETDSSLHLIDIAVLEAYRNGGIGTHLLTQLQQECDFRKKTLRLHVLAASPARRLYRRLGLEEMSADEIYVQMERSPRPASERVSS